MSELVLYQFPVSHYCEKVRWALDYKGLAFEVSNLIPLAHIPVMLRVSRQTKVPALRHGVSVISGSTEILAYLEAQWPERRALFAGSEQVNAEIQEIMEFADREIGPHVRRICYYHILQDKRSSVTLLGEGQKGLGLTGLKVGFPALKLAMRKGMRIDGKGYRKSLDRVAAALDELEKRLGQRKYFVAGRFTAADLTVAALLSPLARPAGSLYARMELVPEGYLQLCELFGERKLIQKTRQWYAQKRSPDV